MAAHPSGHTNGTDTDLVSVEAFVLTTTEVDGASVVTLAGELDIYTAPRLRDLLDGYGGEGTGDVIVDLKDVTFIDSTGIGVLVGAFRRLASFGKTLSLRSPSTTTYKVLEITGLTKNLPILDATEGPDRGMPAPPADPTDQ